MSGNVASSAGNELGGDERGVPRIVGVLDEPLAGMDERDHDGRQVAPVDQVVEHGASGRIAQIVAAVVDHEQRIVRRSRVGESGREIDRRRRLAPQRRAVEGELDERAGGDGRIRHGPLGDDVPGGLAHRVGAERMGRTDRRSEDPRRVGCRSCRRPRACTPGASPSGIARARSHHSLSATGSKHRSLGNPTPKWTRRTEMTGP